MNTDEINKLLERLVDPDEVRFLGVFSRDTIPPSTDINNFPSCLVANTDTSNEPGFHWVALFYRNPETFEFYDTFAQDPLQYSFSPSTLPTNVICNHRRLQGLDSTVCGQHCIYFLYHRSLGFSMLEIVKRFSVSNQRGNDLFVAKFASDHSHKPIRFSLGTFPNLTPPNILQNSHSWKRL